MADDVLVCPYCSKKIPLSKALASQIDEQVKQRSDAAVKKREKELEEEFEQRLANERKSAVVKARKELKTELADLSEQLAEKDALLEKAQKEELALRKRQRELEEKRKALDLEVARKLDERSKEIEKTTAQRVAEEHRLKDREKEEQLAILRRTIEDLKRKAEQGSQQTQGEAGEVELEAILRSAFPHDLIEPIAKGARGADVVQRVHTQAGISCGSILWESKNAKNWSDAWPVKLRDDQRQYKAELAVLVSVALPDDVSRFAYAHEVWISDFASALGIATALRMQLVELQAVRVAAEGKAGKMDLLYTYLSGKELRQRVEAIVESFTSMKEDLDRERAAMEKNWAKRERQIGTVIKSVAGMYGDMQGIIGASLQDIERLQLPSRLRHLRRSIPRADQPLNGLTAACSGRHLALLGAAAEPGR